jgi:hypothetical protein
MAAYETGDPRVPPAKNILPFAELLRRANVPIRIEALKASTHGFQDLYLKYTPAILDFLKPGTPIPSSAQRDKVPIK